MNKLKDNLEPFISELHHCPGETGISGMDNSWIGKSLKEICKLEDYKISGPLGKKAEAIIKKTTDGQMRYYKTLSKKEFIKKRTQEKKRLMITLRKVIRIALCDQKKLPLHINEYNYIGLIAKMRLRHNT